MAFITLKRGIQTRRLLIVSYALDSDAVKLAFFGLSENIAQDLEVVERMFSITEELNSEK